MGLLSFVRKGKKGKSLSMASQKANQAKGANGEPNPESVLTKYKPRIDDPVETVLTQKMDLIDVIAPNEIDIDFDYFKINDVYLRALFVSGYPRFVSPGWLEQIINFNSSLDISFFIYPVEGKSVLDDLIRKIAEMEAEISTDLERGKIVNPSTQAKLEDARLLQEELVKGAEHFFQFGFYITVRAADLEQLNHLSKQVESTLGSTLIVAKHATLDMDSGFLSTAPFGLDRLNITRNMDTTSLATTFPLTSAELSADTGILYGINTQNGSFIIFDRFSMENSNMVIFATSGAGKSENYRMPVLYKDSEGNLQLKAIGDIVEKQFINNKSVRFDRESEGVINPGIKVYGFNKILATEWKDVIVAARKNSPEIQYKINTRSGRSIITTGDHNLIVLNSGQIMPTKTSSIKSGAFIPLPRKINTSTNNTRFLNARHLIPNWPNNIKSNIPLGKEFLTLLGLITSEGYARDKIVAIYNINPFILRLVRVYAKKLGFHTIPLLDKRYKNKLRGHCIRSFYFAKLVHAMGGLGKSGNKQVPTIIYSLTNDQIRYYLQAYFEGDGEIDGHEISCTTKSKGLVSDLAYLLNFFGIIARIGKVKKAASNTERKIKRTYYRIRISGQDNIRKFTNNIGFISKEKNQKAKKLLKKGNTNIDVIPELGPIFKEIYEVLYSSSEIPAPKKFSEIKLGIFKPSPKELQRIIAHIEKRIVEFENLEKDGLLTIKNLPKLGDILEKGKEKQINNKLWKKLGKSWWTLKNNYPPKLRTALKAANITHQYSFDQLDVTGAIYRAFQKTGESLKEFDYSLWSAIINVNQNPLYKKVINARDYISEKYELRKIRLLKVKQKLAWLKTLANSDLYWDEIVKVEKVKSRHKYVYDLQVENGVFLAGFGGMFIHNSYFVKLESLRSLMLGVEVVVIDPEGEYRALAEAVGGQNISFSFSSPSKINPFDLSQVYEEKESHLNLKILSLHSLFKVIMGKITPTQEALLDRALVETYRSKGITQDPQSQKKESPLMEDLYKILVGMETPDALDLAARIEKFVRGSFIGIFDQQTNVEINNPFTVFSIKELQDVLRPIAMFVILDFIWTRVKKDLKPRLLVVDEAWHMMRFEDSAQFLWSIVKRARKYYLGLTTITQDVEDFLSQDIGKAVVTNSALRVLFKQAPAAIDDVGDVFYLSQGERQLLLGANIGEGIFFAGNNHAPITVVASPEEHKLVTTKPQELLSQRVSNVPGQTQVQRSKMNPRI